MEMTNDQMARLSELLDQALPLSADERRAWLEALSEADRPLLASLREALLTADPSSTAAALLEDGPHLEGVNEESFSRQAGERLGAYELLRPLGAGGMAEVWLARRADGAFERDVALKIPRRQGMPADMAERFARECRILARLEFPGIARLYDAGVDASGVPYIAMEFVQGKPITEWCDVHGLNMPARIRVFLQALEAVRQAHALQVLHRDLKPSNIFVTENGDVRLLDFGVARLLQGDGPGPALTQAWGLALTPGYASPELLHGALVDARSDIYSLGVVLHELLTGTRPGNAQTSGPGTGGARALRGALRDVVMQALAPEPARRFADVAGFAAALQTFAGNGLALARLGRGERNWLVAGIAALAIAAGAVAWARLQGTSDPARTEIPIAVLPFENAGDQTEDYRASGFAEMVLNHLAVIPGLQVSGPESNSSFRDTDQNRRDIADRLGVDYLLGGTLDIDGTMLRVNARLTRSHDPTPLLDRHYEQPVAGGIRIVLDNIAKDVAQALAVKLDVGMLARDQGGTNDLEAADRYWRWRRNILEDGSPGQDRRDRIILLQQAVLRDDQFVLAWDGLASELNSMANILEDRGHKYEDDALRAPPAKAEQLHTEAEQWLAAAPRYRADAIYARARVDALAPESWVSWRHRAYAAVLEERWEDAERLARMVYDSAPRTLEKIKPLGDVLFAMGRIEAAIALEEHETELEEDSMWVSRNQQYNLYAAGKTREAEDEYQRSQKLPGSHSDPNHLAFLRLLATEDADPAALRKLNRLPLEGEDVPQLQFNRKFYKLLGDRSALQALVRKEYSAGTYVDHLIADAVGAGDVAIDSYLKFTWQKMRNRGISPAYWHPWLMPNSGVRADPRFKELMIENGLAAYWRKSGKWADFCHEKGPDDFECR